MLTLDPGHLPLRDRAVLRLIGRAEGMTAAQLAVLAYPHLRVAQERLRLMWLTGLLERAPYHARADNGGATYAYRLSKAAHQRLGMPGRPPQGSAYLRHTLDTVEAVCRLVSASPPRRPIVEAWLPESLARGILEPDVRPDSILVLRGPEGATTVCLELDEGTEHQAVIRSKLAAYAATMPSRPTWALLIVVTTEARLNWLRRTAWIDNRPGSWAWATTLADLVRGLAAPVTSLATGHASTLRVLLRGPRATVPIAVGTADWLELLGEGGGEQVVME